MHQQSHLSYILVYPFRLIPKYILGWNQWLLMTRQKIHTYCYIRTFQKTPTEDCSSMEGFNFQGPSAASASKGLKHMQEEAVRAGLEVAPLKVGWYNQVCLLNARLSSVCVKKTVGKGRGVRASAPWATHLTASFLSLEFRKQRTPRGWVPLKGDVLAYPGETSHWKTRLISWTILMKRLL